MTWTKVTKIDYNAVFEGWGAGSWGEESWGSGYPEWNYVTNATDSWTKITKAVE